MSESEKLRRQIRQQAERRLTDTRAELAEAIPGSWHSAECQRVIDRTLETLALLEQSGQQS